MDSMKSSPQFWHKARVWVVWLAVVALVAVLCLVFSSTEAFAATVEVDTFAELEDACQSSNTVVITSAIACTDTINIPKGVTVYLTCNHDAGSTTQDIYRAKGFHGHLFKVSDGANLYVRCCINGNCKDSSGNLRGFAGDNTEASGYYGQAMILNYGHVIMDNDKSVLKNNYNAYNNDYKSGTLWTYDGVKYYGLASGGEGETDLAGSAILCVNGKLTISNGQIYGCYADNGPAIYVCNGYSGDTVKISGGTIKNNVARRYGGAIFAASRKPYDSYSDSASFVGSRTLNSTGSNAMLTVSGGKICNNLARLNSGAVWVGFGGTYYMSGGSIYGNVAVEEGGGGLRLNAGGSGTTGGWMCFANPGGQAWIAGGSIYNNTCATNGGGITVAANDDANNKLTISAGSIYSNTAGSNGGGVYSATNTVISGGNIYKNTSEANGGGVYLTADGKLTMSGGSLYSNTAAQGGGVYFTTSGSASTISGGDIYSNTADSGGGICTYRTAGLTLSNVKVYNNTANTSGGGIRSGGSSGGALTINSGFFYGNTNIGVYVVGGKATINGGKFGVSAYTDYSTYTVSRNTTSQLSIAADAAVTINGTSYPRFVSTLLDGEAIGANRGIINNGTLTITNTSSNAIDMYGTGTSVYNAGTFTINGNFNILSSGKDGTATVQQRLGIQNAAAGTVTMNSADAEIKYCGYRGVVNNGTFTLKAGKIYNCTSADLTVDNGGAVVVSGDNSSFSMSGGEIYNNKANYGAGVYFTTSGKAGTFSGGSIYRNTATKAGGGIGNSRTAGLTLSGTAIYNNTANYGGGVYNAGKITFKGSSVYSNSAVDSVGGGIYNTGDANVFTMTSGKIYNNSAVTHGGGIYYTTAGTASTISGGSIYGNTAKNGAGIYSIRANGLTISGTTISDNTATTYGGGLYIDCPFTITSSTIDSNTAFSISGNMIGGCGGGIYSRSSLTLPSGVVISNNTSSNGGGIYIETDYDETEVDTLTVSGAEISGNIALDGGGVVISACNMVMTSGSITGNSAGQVGDTLSTGEGGGISISGNGQSDRGILTLSGGEISNNTAVADGSADGGGIYCHRAVINMSGGTITNNSCSGSEYSDGGGIFLVERATLNMTGGTISKNTAESGGGVGLVYYYDSTATFSGSAVVTENTATYGGGVYNYGCGEEGGGVFVDGNAKIYKNDAEYGGGIYCDYGYATISGGSIYTNTATQGGGVFIVNNSVLTLTSNSIYSNTAEQGSGVMFYSADCVFYMSDAACVGDTDRDGITDTDDVYLNDNSYITVPSPFTYNSTDSAITTGKKALRALVTPDSAHTGRVIAKYTDDSTAKGTTALYWNASTPKMSEQHFKVNNKVVRAGDQGASSVADSGILNHDVFISEAYTISFEGNLPGYTVTVPSDIPKYWHESLTNVAVSNASVDSKFHSFKGWNTASNGAGTGYFSPISYAENADLTLYAQWDVYTLTINYYSNFADSSSDTVLNAVSGDKSVLVMQSVISPSSDLSNGLYNYWNSSLNLGRTYYTGTGYWDTKADGSGYEVHQDTAFTGLEALSDALGVNASNGSITVNVFAQWEANTLTINYYSNYADSSVGSVLNAVSGDKNVLVKQSVYNPSSDISGGLCNYVDSELLLGRTQYTGTGYWNTKADGSGYGVHEDTAYDHYQKLALALGADVSKGSATVTVYAQWEYTAFLIDIVYDGNGATEGEGWTEEFNASLNDSYTLSNDSEAFVRIEVDAATGTTTLYSFKGWKVGETVYDFGDPIASETLKGLAKTEAGRDNYVVTVYAYWDEYPVINAVDRWFSLDDAQGGKISLVELMKTASAVDGDVGDVTDFAGGDGEFTIIDYDADDFERFTASGSVTITYRAIDKAGNETYRTATVHIVHQDTATDDAVTRLIRFISSKYFKKDDGNYVTPDDGGLHPNSIWIINPEYTTLLTNVLGNTQDEDSGEWANVYQTWTFTAEQIAEVKQYVEAHGPGKTKENNALTNFYNTYKPT